MVSDTYISVLDRECIACPLPSCNEKAAGCRRAARLRQYEGRDYEARRDYHTNYYAMNRERKLQAANDRHARLREQGQL